MAITITCDDSRHARGKVAIIDTLVRSGDVWVSRTTPKATVDVFRRRDDPSGPIWGSARYRRAASKAGRSRQRYKCKLCGAELVCTESTLLWLLEEVVKRGHTRPTLSYLNELVSKRR